MRKNDMTHIRVERSIFEREKPKIKNEISFFIRRNIIYAMTQINMIMLAFFACTFTYGLERGVSDGARRKIGQRKKYAIIALMRSCESIKKE